MSFIHEDFLLQTAAARRLYHEIAAPLPVKSENGQRKFGVRYSREIMETALDKIEYSTHSDSWHSDGPTLQREFENPLYFTRRKFKVLKNNL